jgi:hypothetical protein
MTDDELNAAIERAMRPDEGITSGQIAHSIFGKKRRHKHRIEQQLAALVAAGRLEQFGTGGRNDPFTYRARPSHIVGPAGDPAVVEQP